MEKVLARLYKVRYVYSIILWSFVIVLMVGIYRQWIPWEEMGKSGYIGLFFINLLNGACLVMGGPAQFITFLVAKNAPPLAVGIVGGIGTSFGELVGFFLGKSGSLVFNGIFQSKYEDIKRKAWHVNFDKNPFIILVVLSVIPNPFFDIVSISCGLTGMSLRRYFPPVLLGKVLRFVAISYTGYFVLR